MASRKFTRTETLTVTLPEEGSYDWNVYVDVAVDCFDVAESDVTPAQIAEVMILDYSDRGSACTAAFYVSSTDATLTEVTDA